MMVDYDFSQFDRPRETFEQRRTRIIHERQSKVENRKARRQRQHERKKLKKLLRDC